MRSVFGYIRSYINSLNKWHFALCCIWMALLVYLNYAQDIEGVIYSWSFLPFPDFSAPFVVYSLAYWPALLFYAITRKEKKKLPFWFLVLVLLSPILFAVKVGLTTYLEVFPSRDWELYWNKVLYWPIRLIVLFFMLWICAGWLGKPREILGLRAGSFSWKPYWLMLLIMVPLITLASTQYDFLHTYPKMQQILPLHEGAQPGWLYKLIFELSYGSDFISIEVFFRGFLVIGFSKWLGKDAILLMACFYCAIHFGKPLGECISSYAGGLLLGIVSYHTRNIYGGLMVHLGIAWLMELGGYWGNLLKG